MGQLEALNFFNKLSEADSLTLLQECTLDHAKLFFVQENHVQAFACTLSHKLYTKKFYIDTDRKKINLDHLSLVVTMRLNVFCKQVTRIQHMI